MLGNILLKINYDKKSQTNRAQTWEGMDPKSGTSLWKRTFPKETPRLLSDTNSPLLLVSWPANSDGAKQEWKNDPAMLQKDQAVGAGGDDLLSKPWTSHRPK